MVKEWKEETLDPEDWGKMKLLAKQMAEDMMVYQQTIRERPILKQKTQKVLDYFNQPVPEKPLGPQKTYEEFLHNFIENKGSLISHPCAWAAVAGQGTPFGALADMWMSGMNGIVHNYDLATELEMQVISWFKQILNYPREASGILVSGGSMANLIGLAVARNSKASYDVNRDGANQKLTFYGSTELHSSVPRDLELLGIGSRNLRQIPVDKNYRINLSELREKIEEDRSAGFRPVCVVGNAGSTNVGAIDDLPALVDLSKEEDMWLHVDGAFGSWAALTTKYSHLVEGQEKADSLAFDLHKWMYMPYGIGCTLVKDEDAHYRTFQSNPDYLHHDIRVLSDYTFELSRPSRALKAWMSIKEHGVEKYRRLIEKNIDQSHYVCKLVEESPKLELLAPVQLNVVCFRYTKADLGDDDLDKLNMGIFQKLLEGGKFAVLPSRVAGRTVLRFCNTNHRTTYGDLDRFIDEVIKLGDVVSV